MSLRYFSLILCLIASIELGFNNLLYGQSEWIRKIDLASHDAPGGLFQGEAGTFYLTHRFEDGNGGPVTQNLTKMSDFGDEIWSLKFENYPYHVFEGPAAKLSNDDMMVCFLFEDSLNLSYNIYRINPEGGIQWKVSLPTMVSQEIDYSFRLYKIISITPNDIRLFFRMNYYWATDPPSAKNGYISLDSLGQERYREYFDTNGEYQWPYNIIQAQDSQFIKVYRPRIGQIDGLVLRYELLDKDYQPEWSYEIGPQDEGGGGPVCIDSNGNVYFTWRHDTTGNGSISHQLPSIFSLNKYGKFRWKVHFGEDRSIPIFYDIITMSDGRIIACGQEGNNLLSGGNYRTGWIVCIDTFGNKLWERRYILDEARDSGNNFYYAIESGDGGLTLFGILYREVSGSDVYVMKTDYYGCLIEGCELYNFISLLTSTKNIVEVKNLFYHYLDNSTLIIVSKELSSHNKLSYEMINLNGYVISRGKINNADTQISISGLLPGLYLIRIYDEPGKTHSLLKFFNPE